MGSDVQIGNQLRVLNNCRETSQRGASAELRIVLFRESAIWLECGVWLVLCIVTDSSVAKVSTRTFLLNLSTDLRPQPG